MERIALFHLKTLHMIARLGSFQAAADRLNTTQPAISARIRELETQLGSRLFQREGRRMSLTAQGRQLVLESAPLLNQIEKILLRAADRSSATGIVRIGTGEIAAASSLPDFVSRVGAAFPGVTMEIEVDLTARMLELLLAGKSDMVFLAGPVSHPGIETVPIGALDLVWLARSAFPAETAPDWSRVIWSLPSHSPIYHAARESIAGQHIACQSFNTCNNVRSLIDIVAAGGGIGLFPETMVRAEMAEGSLVEIYRRPQRSIEFQAAVRVRETDNIIRSLFEIAAGLNIDPLRPKQAP